jgi:hypothetical protein
MSAMPLPAFRPGTFEHIEAKIRRDVEAFGGDFEWGKVTSQPPGNRPVNPLPISREVYRATETGLADTFDQLDQGSSFQGSAGATYQDDQPRERRVADQRQEVIAVAGHQNVVAGIRVSEDFAIRGCCWQDFTQADDLMAHCFQSEGRILGDVVVEEESHASVCI